MNQMIDAIYDGGVLKPLIPLTLPDNTRVRITLSTETQDDNDQSLIAQQKAIQEFQAVVRQSSQHQNKDGWSVRQHDQILYGESQ